MNEHIAVLKQLFAAFPNTAASEGTVAMYLRLLRDIPAPQLQTVVDQCVAEMKFLPTVAEVREKYLALTERAGELAAAEAWGMVKAEIRRVGSWGLPEFDDPQVATVVKQMGWLELCASDSPEGVDRAQFMRMYDQTVARKVSEHRLLPQARQMKELAAGVAKQLSVAGRES